MKCSDCFDGPRECNGMVDGRCPFSGDRPKARNRTARLTRKQKDAIAESLGLTKVRGSVSGRVYYE